MTETTDTTNHEPALPTFDASDARALLVAAIDKSGLGARAFARKVLTRDPGLLWRWLDGAKPIPAEVMDKCRELVLDPFAELSRGLLKLVHDKAGGERLGAAEASVMWDAHCILEVHRKRGDPNPPRV